MTTDEAREFGIKLCDAVAFLHEEIEVMYRDLKPDNVMVANGKPVLIDFTTAKEFDTKVAQSPSGSGGGSGPDTVIGDGSTGKYKPAELTGDANVPQGPWTDVYSIGRMLLYATVKLAPSNKDYEVNVSDFGVTVDDYFDEIVVKATHRDPTQRYGSALALKRALENREPEPPKEAELLWFKDGTTYTINPGDTIGRANDGPNTNIELSADYVSAVHCRFDLDSQEDWVLIDKSLNGTYVKKAGDPGDEWHCIRSDEGTERLRNKGHHGKADEREGEVIHLDDGDTIAVVDPDFGGGSDAWYRFST
jgi:serine/threonine protein kinase